MFLIKAHLPQLWSGILYSHECTDIPLFVKLYVKLKSFFFFEERIPKWLRGSRLSI